jgi:hypothetical protein
VQLEVFGQRNGGLWRKRLWLCHREKTSISDTIQSVGDGVEPMGNGRKEAQEKQGQLLDFVGLIIGQLLIVGT